MSRVYFPLRTFFISISESESDSLFFHCKLVQLPMASALEAPPSLGALSVIISPVRRPPLYPDFFFFMSREGTHRNARLRAVLVFL